MYPNSQNDKLGDIIADFPIVLLEISCSLVLSKYL